MNDSQTLENFTGQMSLFLPQRTERERERARAQETINYRKLKTHINFIVWLLPILFQSVCTKGDWVNVRADGIADGIKEIKKFLRADSVFIVRLKSPFGEDLWEYVNYSITVIIWWDLLQIILGGGDGRENLVGKWNGAMDAKLLWLLYDTLVSLFICAWNLPK